ncbi:hypothetical protein OC835_003411 [Tilletia horrida]|nr:hypothetical protein OC835_003411 [Tilletia horrida]
MPPPPPNQPMTSAGAAPQPHTVVMSPMAFQHSSPSQTHHFASASPMSSGPGLATMGHAPGNTYGLGAPFASSSGASYEQNSGLLQSSPTFSSGMSSVSGFSEPAAQFKTMLQGALAQNIQTTRELLAENLSAMEHRMHRKIEGLRSEMNSTRTACSLMVRSVAMPSKRRSQSHSPLKGQDANAPLLLSTTAVGAGSSLTAWTNTALNSTINHIICKRAGISRNQQTFPRIYDLPNVTSLGECPYHPSNYEPHPTDRPVPERDRPPTAESPYRQLRFNFDENVGPDDGLNGVALGDIAEYIFRQGASAGVGPTDTLDGLKDLLRRRFKAWKSNHVKSKAKKLDAHREEINLAGRLSGRISRKAQGRKAQAGHLCGLRVDGGPDEEIDVQHDDFVGAFQDGNQSEENTDPEATSIASQPPRRKGKGKVLRCRQLEWSSGELRHVNRYSDRFRTRHHLVEDDDDEVPLTTATLPVGTQRWMVNAEWAAAHQEECRYVLLNNGPFLGQEPIRPWAVISGPKAWGSGVSSKKRRITGGTTTTQLVVEQRHSLASTFRFPYECGFKAYDLVQPPSAPETRATSPEATTHPSPRAPPQDVAATRSGVGRAITGPSSRPLVTENGAGYATRAPAGQAQGWTSAVPPSPAPLGGHGPGGTSAVPALAANSSGPVLGAETSDTQQSALFFDSQYSRQDTAGFPLGQSAETSQDTSFGSSQDTSFGSSQDTSFGSDPSTHSSQTTMSYSQGSSFSARSSRHTIQQGFLGAESRPSHSQAAALGMWGEASCSGTASGASATGVVNHATLDPASTEATVDMLRSRGPAFSQGAQNAWNGPSLDLLASQTNVMHMPILIW